MQPDQNLERAASTARLRERARGDYPLLWRNLIEDWGTDGKDNTAWLTYSANYLFRTAGLRWAMDPLGLPARLVDVPEPDYARDLADCTLVVLTHAHKDHLDLELVSALSRLPIQWVIPEHTLPAVLAKVDLPAARIIIPQNGRPITIGSVSLTPFEGLHRRGRHGIEATGYLVEFEDQRWLFPGDTRQYDLQRLPSFGRLDGCFAHLWLGRGCATRGCPPLLDEFCSFFAGLKAHQLVVTHLEELGRNEADLWDGRHYRMVERRLAEAFQVSSIRPAKMGERVMLEGCVDQPGRDRVQPQTEGEPPII